MSGAYSRTFFFLENPMSETKRKDFTTLDLVFTILLAALIAVLGYQSHKGLKYRQNTQCVENLILHAPNDTPDRITPKANGIGTP